MKYRRFGRTEYDISVISCGGMRYQQSWKDNDPVTDECQANLEACIRRALDVGINHIETARGYGTSEFQLGKILPLLPRDEMYIQTKVAPEENPEKFRENFELSMSLLNLDHVDIFSFHGINTPLHLEWAYKCYDVYAKQWLKEGRIRDVGFSTHGDLRVINKALQSGIFDHVNLHWYYINQENWPAIEEAKKQDAGVFIISPNDKGGLLYKPSEKLLELTAPLHPMVFNGLFCMSRPDVHTLSCGAAKPEDFDLHIEMTELMDRSDELLPPILKRLEESLVSTLGEEWVRSWDQQLPYWDQTPGEVNIPIILRLRNLALAFDMVEYGKMRYNLLGNGDHWFPGEKSGKLSDVDITPAIAQSPHAAQIPSALEEAHAMLQGEEKKRLQED